METTHLGDILLWIESPSSFFTGIGKLESKEEIERYKVLLSQVLEGPSKAWEDMKPEELERTIESFKNMRERCHSLVNEFSSQIDYYQNGLYEVIIPHEWEGVPPKGGKPEIIESNIKKYYDHQNTRIEHEKVNLKSILFSVWGYYSIADCWQKESDLQIKKAERLKDMKNIGSTSIDVSESEILPIICLKPSDGIDIFSGIPGLRRGLIKLGLISPEVTVPELRALFGFNDLTGPFPWIGERVALRQFVLDLLNFEKIEKFPSRMKWATVARLFVLVNVPDADLRTLKGDNGVYKYQKELRDLIRDL